MAKSLTTYISKSGHSVSSACTRFWRWLGRHWRRSLWQKIKIIGVCVVVFWFAAAYGIAQWYIHHENKPVALGVSFIPAYARYLGLDPQVTMDALLNDVHVKNFRLTSYWDIGEPSKGHYDFSELDWEFAKADKAHAHIILTIGLRQPRWPECHPPSWVDTSQPWQQWYPALKNYMAAVINRYKDNPALASYQLENEYFLKGFGHCQDMSRQRLVDEFNLVRSLDPHHQIIIGRSNNALGWPVGAPTPDEFSISIYRRVWDANATHRYLEYPFPAWYYAMVAGWQQMWTGKDMIIGELQAEPWIPPGKSILTTSLAEQSKSFNAARLKDTIQFAKGTGMKGIYLWGAEYWYYRLTVLHDPSVWNTAKQEFNASTH